MSNTLNKFVLAPVLISTTIFAVLTLPLCLFGKKTVTIQFQEEPVFQGQLRDISTPYLGLASVFSLGAGIASFALLGWRHSSRKSSQIEAQVSNLARNLQAKEAQIEVLQGFESQLPEKKIITPATNLQPVARSISLPAQEVAEINLHLQEIMTQMASVQATLSATNTTGSLDNLKIKS